MPAFVKTSEQEELWAKAKAQAAKQGRGGDYAYITGIFKKMGGLEKSLGSTVPPQYRVFKIPGQVPDRRTLQELQALTAMPSRRMSLIDTVHPCFTAGRVVEGLPLSQDWERHIAKAMTSPNELVMRQDLFSRMHSERMDPGLRRELFARSLSLWREKGRLSKSVSVRTVGDLKKAGPFVGPRGGKWKDAKHTIPWSEAKAEPRQTFEIFDETHQTWWTPKALFGLTPAEAKSEIKKLKAKGITHRKAKAGRPEPPKAPAKLKGKTDTQEQYGVKWETGKPATFTFSRNLEAAPKLKRGMEDRFQQRVEPTGRYMIQVSEGSKALPNHIVDEITFQKPLVLKGNSREALGGYDDDSWKMNLSRAFGGKKGKALSAAVAKAGYDGIVTTGKHGTSEIVDLRYHHTGIIEKALFKAEPRGGTYIKRVPKPGGGFTYFYDEDKYKAHPDAHVSGGEAAEAAITKAVAGHIKTAGKNGCELSTFRALVKRYGAEMVGGFLNQVCASGQLVYKGKRLFAKGAPSKSGQKSTPEKRQKSTPERTKTGPEQTPKSHGTEKKQETSTKKSCYFFVEPLQKAGPHKYIRRTPKPGGGYNYYYAESAAAREAKAGEEIRLGEHTVKVIAVGEQSGAVRIEIDGKQETVTAAQWHDKLANHYGDAFLKGAERRAKQTINAVLRHVPRAMLEDLKGDSDEARLDDLERRLPAVYAKLQKAFSRAGMSPFAAKQSLGLVLERRGWEPEARAAAIGTVIRYRDIGTREMISASENLAGGQKVLAGHVAAAVELRAPGGKVGTFPEETTKLAKSAEADLAVLSKMLAGARKDPQMAAEVLAHVAGSEAMQKLSMVAQAFPGLQDRAIEPVRKAILGAHSVVPNKPTTEGADTIVYVAGEGGRPKALEARYRLVEADTLIPSHDSETFARHKDYPEGVQERAYHRDKAEQAKVIRNAQKMDPRFIINTNPDAVNGPPMVTSEGIVLGGNSRAMSVQRIYKQHPGKAKEMREYLETHAHEAGLTAGDIRAMKAPVLIREVEVEDKSKPGLQLLVRQMNESFTQGMDPRTMQVAMGRKLTDRTLQALADSMTEDETLAAFLASSRSERFVGSLFNAGIIDNRNVNQYMRKGTRTLNNDGRTLVSRILVGRTVDNADLLSDTGVQMLDSIAGSVPAMVQAASHGKGFDLGEDLGVAIDAFNGLQRRVDQGVLPALDPKMSSGALNRLYNYFDVLPGIGEPHPVVKNERAQVLLEVLIRKRGPTQMAKVFRGYARIAAANPEGQAVLFAEARTSPIEAIKQAAGMGEIRGEEPPELRLVASMSGRRADPRFVLGRVS